MLDKEFISEKFKNISEYLSETEEVLKVDDAMIARDFRLLRTLERNFQLIVDELVDVNVYLIRELELKTADDFQNTFRILAEANILPSDLAERMAPVVGLRNMLVHRYEKINKNLFVRQVRNEYSDFIQYLTCVNDYLTSNQ